MEVSLLIVGIVGAILVGFTLGLLGGGGSILTVPLLVYVIGINPVSATAYSLFIVGVSAFIGALKYMRKGLVNYRAAIIFVVPSFIAVFLTRKFLIPAVPEVLVNVNGSDVTTDLVFAFVLILALLGTAMLLLKRNLNQTGQDNFGKVILLLLPAALAVFLVRQLLIPQLPENLFYIGDFMITKDMAVMLFFSVVMILAGIAMVRKQSEKSREDQRINNARIIVQGLGVGLVSGITGAGGGFLIIPSLVMFARLPMKLAVGTSLLIISVQSLIGFMGDLGGSPMDWKFLLLFTAFSIVGILIGAQVSNKIENNQLKKTFGVFVLLMSVVILIQEIIKMN